MSPCPHPRRTHAPTGTPHRATGEATPERDGDSTRHPCGCAATGTPHPLDPGQDRRGDQIGGPPDRMHRPGRTPCPHPVPEIAGQDTHPGDRDRMPPGAHTGPQERTGCPQRGADTTPAPKSPAEGRKRAKDEGRGSRPPEIMPRRSPPGEMPGRSSPGNTRTAPEMPPHPLGCCAPLSMHTPYREHPAERTKTHHRGHAERQGRREG